MNNIGWLAYIIGGLAFCYGPIAWTGPAMGIIIFGAICHWKFWAAFIFGAWLGSKLG